MNVYWTSGNEDVATVYVADMGRNRWVEFVESIQPPLPRNKKWVHIVSSLFGCPVRCLMCDAGMQYKGKMTAAEIFSQIDFMVRRRFPDGVIPVEKYKIQFARMGEPALNAAVLDVLDELPLRLNAPGLLPSISTVAPQGCDRFFERLLEIKEKHYLGGRFQMQFSIHSTCGEWRKKIIPVEKWSFSQIASYGERFRSYGDKKITLNFALIRGVPIDPAVLLQHFDPRHFILKITPVNPTYQAEFNRLASHLDPQSTSEDILVEELRMVGYEVIPSIGELEENLIGSNCGQSLIKHLNEPKGLADKGYTYQVRDWRSGATDSAFPVSTRPVL